VSDKSVYQCQVCKLHYESKELAQQCEAFCSANTACSFEISQHSVEYQQLIARRQQKEQA